METSAKRLNGILFSSCSAEAEHPRPDGEAGKNSAVSTDGRSLPRLRRSRHGWSAFADHDGFHRGALKGGEGEVESLLKIANWIQSKAHGEGLKPLEEARAA